MFILRRVDQIFIKLDIQKDLMSHMLHFQFGLNPGTFGMERGTEILETGNFEKRLEWRDRDEI